ncbi:hypothetical protein K470DRAFT_171361 [Piedraia hortae CBS 480.64]|uniref:Uncharacterized protein n=1 Tax=Piedraia hortae CBS 480.64 TaxID=1314780 RepID=A0A6A7BRI4_9PEZI|nr:hypothetical protein K470DRAFT_171361 [Piedraia hortae CBS 480.64]
MPGLLRTIQKPACRQRARIAIEEPFSSGGFTAGLLAVWGDDLPGMCVRLKTVLAQFMEYWLLLSPQCAGGRHTAGGTFLGLGNKQAWSSPYSRCITLLRRWLQQTKSSARVFFERCHGTAKGSSQMLLRWLGRVDRESPHNLHSRYQVSQALFNCIPPLERVYYLLLQPG